MTPTPIKEHLTRWHCSTAFAVAGILWLLSDLTKPEVKGITIFISIFSLIYLVVKQVKNKKIALSFNAIVFSTVFQL